MIRCIEVVKKQSVIPKSCAGGILLRPLSLLVSEAESVPLIEDIASCTTAKPSICIGTYHYVRAETGAL